MGRDLSVSIPAKRNINYLQLIKDIDLNSHLVKDRHQMFALRQI